MLKLAARDRDDLEVISAQMQDALIRLADIRYVQKTRQFALVANRFAWEAQPARERHRTGLHFENVLAVKRHGLKQSDPDVILSLMSISFADTDAPAGVVTLTFANGAALRLEVEYLDCLLKDLGGVWGAGRTPDHGV